MSVKPNFPYDQTNLKSSSIFTTRELVLIFFAVFVSCALINSVKFIIKNLKFPFPLFVTTCHMLASWLYCVVYFEILKLRTENKTHRQVGRKFQFFTKNDVERGKEGTPRSETELCSASPPPPMVAEVPNHTRDEWRKF